ncbi:hypothetical protein OTSUT76_4039 [Orientia tsutsugamushi str. UT76]|uniref:Uncharacterized protein n=1 Tax=Orientia tsutsugamushi TaxID=784 RepID=A0A2U3QUU5_ORITS|nr:hypothetical protein [Orientia tsutsugamushi]KJV70212.1 hypothetical protein OTSUT76_4039 [Orientia tsutsugamushi str. UT76]SPR04764.1 Uncharacterised protein [Orientia tsutsugamushi]
MFKRLRKALQLKPAAFQPASSVAMVEAHESKETRESQKVQQQNENSSGVAASSGPKPEKHVSFSENVQVKVRTPSSPSSPSSPIHPSCNPESGFIFPKTPDEQSYPIPSSSILARYYADAKNTGTSSDTQRNPQSAIFSGKSLSKRMQIIYESSLMSQGIFTKPDNTDDQEENSDQCSYEELSVDVAGACGGYDHDG